MSDSLLQARFDAAMAALPLVAILRGLTPQDCLPVCRALEATGFRLMEIPLNSPEPFDSIAQVRAAMPAEVLVGAGTVTSVEAVAQLAQTGAELAVMPHADTKVIRAAKAAGLLCVPGVATPTEAFAALEAGADALKIFPAELVGPAAIRAMRAVLPKGTRLLPVGGISPATMAPFLEAGVAGFGLGSALYRPGDSAETVAGHARDFVAAYLGQAVPA
ncbi:2-dehydro-3-deoxy-6-phosphogalactonate aldolase [Poseidonocella sp. HB161398]|uniref:2-dehydro-3-deoxy-6-phosphogalactonate aldolase n=1 Tax=Poseidonocella sp. HB161398 TaxID=2320855 RepID=UPI0011096D56|nr:2-dehydro-3-deoxy-6-phosphogalactonate aldolase [Poseidonocella sp. HB161398]